MNKPQLMWLDVITATLQQPTFDMSIGNMGYVFKNMIAKYVSSADFYKTTVGVEKLIEEDKDLVEKILSEESINLKKYFYGKDKNTLLEHSIPTSVIANLLISSNRSREEVERILLNSGDVIIALRIEDKLLAKSKMPSNWKLGDDTLARYHEAGVSIGKYLVKRGNVIYR